MKSKHWKIVFYTTGALPFGFVISLMAFYLHAAIILGRFPRYNQPDPKELNIYEANSELIHVCGNIWLISILLFFVITLLHLVIKRKQVNWRLIAISSIGHIIAFGLFFSEVAEWFFD